MCHWSVPTDTHGWALPGLPAKARTRRQERRRRLRKRAVSERARSAASPCLPSQTAHRTRKYNSHPQKPSSLFFTFLGGPRSSFISYQSGNFISRTEAHVAQVVCPSPHPPTSLRNLSSPEPGKKQPDHVTFPSPWLELIGPECAHTPPGTPPTPYLGIRG